jgi:prepilin-type N-terminal cleavage/methylation domain-containing protein
MTAQKGFTLVELLVVVSIVTILSGILIPSFTSYLRLQNIKQAQQQLVSDMRSVQNKALTGTLSDQEIPVDSDVYITHWGIDFSDGTDNYTYFVTIQTADCGSVAGNNRLDIDTYHLNQNVFTFSAPDCVLFDMQNGNIFVPGDSEYFIERDIEVGFAELNPENKKVLFNSSGLIYAGN